MSNIRPSARPSSPVNTASTPIVHGEDDEWQYCNCGAIDARSCVSDSIEECVCLSRAFFRSVGWPVYGSLDEGEEVACPAHQIEEAESREAERDEDSDYSYHPTEGERSPHYRRDYADYQEERNHAESAQEPENRGFILRRSCKSVEASEAIRVIWKVTKLGKTGNAQGEKKDQDPRGRPPRRKLQMLRISPRRCRCPQRFYLKLISRQSRLHSGVEGRPAVQWASRYSPLQ